ncbi:MAG: hypothetical protein MRJ96_07975 [Nitrospirales bacterium]|nr:hypothetical protein [Nitrospira sp.]MDR4501370.1 hypothetical protein [Nitrospirales bacterium]
MSQSVASEALPFRLAIFTATRWEFRSVQESITVDESLAIAGTRGIVGRVGRVHVYVFQSGIGLQNAYRVSQAVLSLQSWDLVISSGFAGALVPCDIGTLVNGHAVLLDQAAEVPGFLHSRPIVCDEYFQAKVSEVASSLGSERRSGTIVSTSRIVGTGREKHSLAVRTNAVALDMESASLGQMAREQHIPFLVVRTISDLVDEDLPVDFNLFLQPKLWPKGIGQILRRPLCLLRMLTLRNHMLVASRQLTVFFQEFFNCMSRGSCSSDISHSRF